MSNSFLCTNCRREMCNDCRQIAEEFDELLKRRTTALAIANDRTERLERELADANRRAAMYEQVSKAGINQIIVAWMDKEIEQILGG